MGKKVPFFHTLVLWYFGSCVTAVTGSLSGPRKLFKGVIPATSGVLARFPLALPCPELFCELRGLCRRSYFGHWGAEEVV